MLKRIITFLKSQVGNVDISNILLLGIGMLMMAVGAYFIEPVIDAFDDARTAGNVTQFIALSTVIGIGPTLIVLGFIVAGAVVGFLGIKGIKGG